MACFNRNDGSTAHTALLSQLIVREPQFTSTHAQKPPEVIKGREWDGVFGLEGHV